MSVYGYARVSSQEQNEDRQLIALQEQGVPRRSIYIDKKSGKDFERPAYQRLLRRLREGDLVILKSIDRLGRNYQEVMDQWRIITKEIGADVKVIDMPLLDTTVAKDLLGTFIADLVLQVLSFVSENERTNIKLRQAEGIAAAKRRGVKFGRPCKNLPDNFDELFHLWREKKISSEELSMQCNMAMSVIYKKMRLREDGIYNEG